ncbi:hypothetical protein BLA29_008877 [Euroglyphus maynei]|uniref:Uncharacterized protein n=1 Tax=Euroglyphus maynei TaxID=6958 RepID=A0A1Y3BMA1_EURMA|nr:hypothetical protein BLA29_008877 [Euroglyphus maynei]
MKSHSHKSHKNTFSHRVQL